MIAKVCPQCSELKPLDAFGRAMRKFASGPKLTVQSYCKACRVRLQCERDKRNPEKLKVSRRKIKLRSNYGISPEQHEAQVVAQNGRCAICRRELAGLSAQTVHVDHCHATGSLRGILCGPCNTGLGSFRDSPEQLRAAIRYLSTGGVWQITASEAA